MHDTKPLNLIHPVKSREPKQASPYIPEDMAKSKGDFCGDMMGDGCEKHPMPSHNRAKMPQMKP